MRLSVPSKKARLRAHNLSVFSCSCHELTGCTHHTRALLQVDATVVVSGGALEFMVCKARVEAKRVVGIREVGPPKGAQGVAQRASQTQMATADSAEVRRLCVVPWPFGIGSTDAAAQRCSTRACRLRQHQHH